MLLRFGYSFVCHNKDWLFALGLIVILCTSIYVLMRMRRLIFQEIHIQTKV